MRLTGFVTRAEARRDEPLLPAAMDRVGEANDACFIVKDHGVVPKFLRNSLGSPPVRFSGPEGPGDSAPIRIGMGFLGHPSGSTLHLCSSSHLTELQSSEPQLLKDVVHNTFTVPVDAFSSRAIALFERPRRASWSDLLLSRG